jgi:hypothetical protein
VINSENAVSRKQAPTNDGLRTPKSFGVEFSAKGAAFNVEPGASPQESWEKNTSAESAIHPCQVQKLDDSRFQRLFFTKIQCLGALP